MHAYLISGQNIEELDKKIEEILVKLGSKMVGFDLKKIADVRNLTKFTSLGLSEKTTIVIRDIDKASVDTQNAFLKSLEEPQDNLSYILTANSQESLLPTIVSRCQLVELKSKKTKLEPEAEKTAIDFLNATSGQKLQTISKITKREDALGFVDVLISVLEARLKNDGSLVFGLEKALETRKRIKANGNVQLQLTNLVISLKSVHI